MLIHDADVAIYRHKQGGWPCNCIFVAPSEQFVGHPCHCTCTYVHTHTCAHTQLFDTDNVVNRYSSQFIFTTEGHVIQLDPALRRRPWDRDSFQDTHRCLEDTKRAVARVNESFVSHSVSLCIYIYGLTWRRGIWEK